MIHPLWYICLLIRSFLVLLVQIIFKKNNPLFQKIILYLIGIIGFGFLYKSITGSDEEYQIAKVFWHSTRWVHSTIYLLSFVFLLNKYVNVSTILLVIDILFSVIYRILKRK